MVSEVAKKRRQFGPEFLRSGEPPDLTIQVTYAWGLHPGTLCLLRATALGLMNMAYRSYG